MRPRSSRWFGAVAMLIVLTAAGCSPSEAEPTPSASPSISANLSGVTVGGTKDSPTLTVPTPLSVTATQKKILTEGTGAAAERGKRVTIDYIGYNGTDGRPFDSSYGSSPRSFLLSDEGNLKGLVESLTGLKSGSRVLLAIPPSDAYGLKGQPTAGIGPTDTIVLLVDLRGVKDVLSRATGTAVPPKAGLPQVALSANGAPKITIPSTAPPKTLVAQPLITGKGPKVTKGQQITVNYTGVIWASGKQFDTTWGSQPATFEIGTGKVISGWDRSLVGQPVGSQLLLVIPPDDGYGAEGNPDVGIKGTDTLVFVVDILDAA